MDRVSVRWDCHHNDPKGILWFRRATCWVATRTPPCHCLFPQTTESTAQATRRVHCPCSTSPCPGAHPHALASLLPRSTGRFPLRSPAQGWGEVAPTSLLPIKKPRAARPTDPFTVKLRTPMPTEVQIQGWILDRMLACQQRCKTRAISLTACWPANRSAKPGLYP